MKSSSRTSVLALLFMLFCQTAAASGRTPVSGDRGTDMLVDAVVVRPLGVVATLIGTTLTVVTLPFTIPSGSVESTVQEWIVRPADYTFRRPLGDFGDGAAD